jgi:outer membrane murein-binding lipoprotein Lpp
VRAERASNALAAIVIERISGDYVQQKINSFTTQLKTLNVQVASVNRRIAALTGALNQADKNGLNQIDQLVLVNLLDTSEARLGGLIQAQSLAQQQLALAKNVESPRVVQQGAAVKTTARSRRTSIIVGAIIGLLIGAVAAIVVDSRAGRPRPA